MKIILTDNERALIIESLENMEADPQWDFTNKDMESLIDLYKKLKYAVPQQLIIDKLLLGMD